jgi:hypothetical protein
LAMRVIATRITGRFEHFPVDLNREGFTKR